MRTTRATIGALGAGLSLAVAASVALLVISSVIAFRGWPDDVSSAADPASAALASSSPLHSPSAPARLRRDATLLRSHPGRSRPRRPAHRGARGAAARRPAPIAGAPASHASPAAVEAPAASAGPGAINISVPSVGSAVSGATNQAAAAVQQTTQAAADTVGPVAPAAAGALEQIGAAGGAAVAAVGQTAGDAVSSLLPPGQ